MTREVQLTACNDLIGSRGWVHDPSTDVFADFGKSAYQRGVTRPGFDRLLAAARAGAYEHIVVYRLDRFSRDWKTWAEALERTETSFAIHSATEGLSSSTDRMAVQFLAAVAEQESSNISDRVTGVKANLLAAGKWPGGVRPFGFAVVPAPDGRGKVLEVNKAERELLVEAVDRVLRGDSVRQVAMDWNARGVQTSMGKAWWPSTMYRLLRSPLLVGERAARRTGEPERPYPALIDDDSYGRLLAKLERRTTTRTRSDGALLSGLLECAECGARLGGYSDATKWSNTYRCPRRSQQGPQSCPGVSISSRRVEQAVVGFAMLLMESPHYMARVLKPVDVPVSPERNEWAKLHRNLERLEADYYAGDFSASTGGEQRYRKHRSQLLGRIQELEKVVGSDAVPDAPDPVPLVDFINGVPNLFNLEGRFLSDLVREYWADLDRNAQREVLRSLLHRVTVTKGRPQQKGVPRDQRFDRRRISVAPWAWSNGDRLVPLPDAEEELLFPPFEDDDPYSDIPEGFTPEEWDQFWRERLASKSFDPWGSDDEA